MQYGLVMIKFVSLQKNKSYEYNSITGIYQ